MNVVTEALFNSLTDGSATADEFEVTQEGDTLTLHHYENGWFKVTIESIETPADAEDITYDSFGGRQL